MTGSGGVFNFSRNGNATIPNALKLNVSVVLYVNCDTVAILKTIRNYLKDSWFSYSLKVYDEVESCFFSVGAFVTNLRHKWMV